MQPNKNQYNAKEFQQIFTGTDLHTKLQQDFEILLFGGETKQEIRDDRTPRHLDACRKFSVVPFYYLKFLTDQNPASIYDLGCGWNIFKKYIPNIIGVSADVVGSKHYHGDVHGYVDQNYVQAHKEYFDSVFSINALHFVPLSNMRRVVMDFISMIAPGGHGFLTLNLARMLERDNVKFANYTVEDFDNYVRTELNDLPVNLTVFDVNLTNPDYNLDNFMDGNIRLVCHKTT